MSDDEGSREVSPEPEPPKPAPPAPTFDHHDEGGKSEAMERMESEMKKRREKADEEWLEYEEMRKVEREKEKEEIQQLRERRERRRQEREEEERRMAEIRAQEDARRKAEEEERNAKKREEEARKREEREKKRQADMEKLNMSGKPNFTIQKGIGGADRSMEGKQEGEQKSKEQLEAERKAALEQRCQPLNISGFGVDQLKQKAKELFDRIYKLESEKYDYVKRFEQQSYDMQELSEKARQANKGGGKRNTAQPAVAAPDPLAGKISGIPPKVVMYSQYERVKDHRSFGERRECFVGPLFQDEYVRINPTNRIVMTEMGARIDGEIEGAGGQDAGADIVVEED